MQLVRVLAALLILAIVGAAPTVADEKSVTIHVRVTDADGKPVSGAEVKIHPFGWRKYGLGIINGTADENGDFAADADGDGNYYEAGVYRISVTDKNGDRSHTIIYVSSNGKEPSITGLQIRPNTKVVGAEMAIEAANAAAERGDKDGFKTNLSTAKRRIQEDEVLMKEARTAADAFAQDNNLRSRDLSGVSKDLKRVEQAGELGNKELETKLREQKGTLEGIQRIQKSIESNKSKIAELEAKYGSLLVFLPSACPEGEGGGLLAGTLNSLFDTDLAASNCGETETQGTHGKGEKKPREDKRP